MCCCTRSVLCKDRFGDGNFDIKDVCDKLMRQTPVFRHLTFSGEVKAETAGQVSENWERAPKLKEKDGNKSVWR